MKINIIKLFILGMLLLLNGCRNNNSLRFNENTPSPGNITLIMSQSNINVAAGESIELTIHNPSSLTATGLEIGKSSSLSSISFQGNCDTIPAAGQCILTINALSNTEIESGQITVSGGNVATSKIAIHVLLPLSMNYISLSSENASDFYTDTINGPRFGVVSVTNSEQSGVPNFELNNIKLSEGSSVSIISRGNDATDAVYGKNLECFTMNSGEYKINTLAPGESCIIVLESTGTKSVGSTNDQLTIMANSSIIGSSSQTFNLTDSGNLYLSTTASQLQANVTQWNGNTWAPLPLVNQPYPTSALVADSKGNIYVGFKRILRGTPYGGIFKWNGSTWSTIYSGNADVTALTVDSKDNLYAGMGGAVAEWDGTEWTSLGSIGNTVTTLAVDSAGNLYAGGGNNSGANAGSEHYQVMQWSENTWKPIGAINVNYSSIISSLVIDNNRNVYVSGYFSLSPAVNPVTWLQVAKLDNNNWISMNANLPANTGIYNLVFDSSGNLYATSFSSIFKWNGNAWTNINAANYTQLMTNDSLGNIYAAGNYVAQWNGNNWSSLSGSNYTPTGLAIVRTLRIQ